MVEIATIGGKPPLQGRSVYGAGVFFIALF